jgi:hypothetical protein
MAMKKSRHKLCSYWESLKRQVSVVGRGRKRGLAPVLEADQQEAFVDSLNDCLAVFEEIRRCSQFGGSPGTGQYDPLEVENYQDASTALAERCNVASCFWMDAADRWLGGKPLTADLLAMDYGWLEYIMEAVRHCEEQVRQELDQSRGRRGGGLRLHSVRRVTPLASCERPRVVAH